MRKAAVIRLDLPFYRNDGDGCQCMQVAMKVVCKYFLDREFDLDELDQLTGRGPGKWTWTTQIVTVLHQLGLDVRLFSNTELSPFLEGEPFLKRKFGEQTAQIMLDNSDWPVTEKSILRVIEMDLHSTDIPAFKDIESELARGTVPLILFDDNVLKQKPASYRGHFCPLTGYAPTQVSYHECGPGDPEAHCAVDRSLFIRAWNAVGTDNDLVMVYGTR